MWKPPNPFRRRKDSGASAVAAERDLWWVRLILNVGRPVVAVIVLVMCAPGEHHLAKQAGWSDELAWGMPATLTAYAGIAAVVATKRPRGAPGKSTAVAGAIVSVLLAMAAQPVAHLYGKTGLDMQKIVLICVVSCIPALVFGHLLHMAAAPAHAPVSRTTPDDAGQSGTPADVIAKAFDVPADMIRGQDNFVPALSMEPGSDAMRYVPGDTEEDTVDWQDTVPDTEEDTDRGLTEDNSSLEYLRRPVLSLVRDAEVSRPLSRVPGDMTRTDELVTHVSVHPSVRPDVQASVRPDVQASRPKRTGRDRNGTPSLPSRIRGLIDDTPGVTDDEIKSHPSLSGEKTNSVTKALKRVRDEEK